MRAYDVVAVSSVVLLAAEERSTKRHFETIGKYCCCVSVGVHCESGVLVGVQTHVPCHVVATVHAVGTIHRLAVFITHDGTVCVVTVIRLYRSVRQCKERVGGIVKGAIGVVLLVHACHFGIRVACAQVDTRLEVTNRIVIGYQTTVES